MTTILIVLSIGCIMCSTVVELTSINDFKRSTLAPVMFGVGLAVLAVAMICKDV